MSGVDVRGFGIGLFIYTTSIWKDWVAKCIWKVTLFCVCSSFRYLVHWLIMFDSCLPRRIKYRVDTVFASMEPMYFSQGFAVHERGRKKKLPQGRLLQKCVKPSSTYLAQTICSFFLCLFFSQHKYLCLLARILVIFNSLSGGRFFFLPMPCSTKPYEKQHGGDWHQLHPFVQAQYRSVAGLCLLNIFLSLYLSQPGNACADLSNLKINSM